MPQNTSYIYLFGRIPTSRHRLNVPSPTGGPIWPAFPDSSQEIHVNGSKGSTINDLQGRGKIENEFIFPTGKECLLKNIYFFLEKGLRNFFLLISCTHTPEE